MLPEEAYLLDMLNAARRVLKFSSGLTWEVFQQSELHQSALVKQLEIVGEAARRISAEFKKKHPEIPWNDMVGMRNRLIHDYTRVDLQIVWDTIQKDIAPLIGLLGPIVPPEHPSGPINGLTSL